MAAAACATPSSGSARSRAVALAYDRTGRAVPEVALAVVRQQPAPAVHRHQEVEGVVVAAVVQIQGLASHDGLPHRIAVSHGVVDEHPDHATVVGGRPRDLHGEHRGGQAADLQLGPEPHQCTPPLGSAWVATAAASPRHEHKRDGLGEMETAGPHDKEFRS